MIGSKPASISTCRTHGFAHPNEKCTSMKNQNNANDSYHAFYFLINIIAIQSANCLAISIYFSLPRPLQAAGSVDVTKPVNELPSFVLPVLVAETVYWISHIGGDGDEETVESEDDKTEKFPVIICILTLINDTLQCSEDGTHCCQS